MIARITGILEDLTPTAAIVAPPGIGVAYEVAVPAYLLRDLAPRMGQSVTFTTTEVLEPIGGGTSFRPRLIGFDSPAERRFYELFTTVKGVGGKRALRAMTIPAASIARAIEEDDAAALRALPEIGKRLAETVIAELSGKVGEFLEGEPGAGAIAEPKPAGALDESAEQAVEALVRLGQTRIEAERAVEKAVERLPEKPTADQILAAAFAGSA
jgi:Holliday junction DNA helicase RuvA